MWITSIPPISRLNLAPFRFHANSQFWEEMLAMNLEAAASSDTLTVAFDHAAGSLMVRL